MKKVIRYVRHNKSVAVFAKYIGIHREHCLCWDCGKFYHDDREKNCPIANILYSMCVAFGLTTPVWECETYVLPRDGQLDEKE